MGRRGKERAKQAKAAREIKYHSLATDFNELQRELGGGSSQHEAEADYDESESDEDSASSRSDSGHSRRVSS